MATATATEIDRNALVGLYRQMLLIRKCELQLAKAHQQGLVHGACHTCVGQEAVAVGVCANLNTDDVVFSTHRGHGHALAKGVPPEELFAELFGRVTGCSHGRGGSMHLFSPETGVMGTSGIVGPCILQAVGAGYSFKLLRQDRIAVAFFGDGAVNNGAFHEGLNMAALWNLPVLFICENNQYATEIAFRNATRNAHVANRGPAYGIPGQQIDGNDVLAVYRTVHAAAKRARQGGGPTLIECNTYRLRPHSEGMSDFTYRSRGEVNDWKSKCPLASMRAVLEANNDQDFHPETELEAIEREVAEIVEHAYSEAKSAPFPQSHVASLHVFSDSAFRANDRPNVRSVEVGASQPEFEPAAESRVITFVDATREALDYAMRLDPSIFVMGEGIGERGGNFNTTANLFARYGADRLCDTPICERGFVGLSAGAAMTGTRPVIDFMFADFILDAVGEILNQIAKIQYMSNGRLKMPVVLRGCIGVGHSAATHHSGSYYSMFAHFPGLKVVVPSNPYDAKGLFATALSSDDPVVFLEHRELLTTRGIVPSAHYEIEFGKAAIVRAGMHITLVAIAHMVPKCLEAASMLAGEHIEIELIDPRSVAPLDMTTIVESVQKTGRLLIVDESFGPFGLGAEIATRVNEMGFDELDAPIRRLNGVHTPTPYSPTLEAAVIPQVNDIVNAVRELAAQ